MRIFVNIEIWFGIYNILFLIIFFRSNPIITRLNKGVNQITKLGSSTPLAILLGVQKIITEDIVKSSCLLQEVINNMRSVQISGGGGFGKDGGDEYREDEDEETGKGSRSFGLHIRTGVCHNDCLSEKQKN